MKAIHNLFKVRNKSFAILILAAPTGFCSCKKADHSDSVNGQINYSGSFGKSKDLVDTSATEITTATFDRVMLELSYSTAWTGLGTTVVNMHFHDSGSVMTGITSFPNAASGTVSGTVTLTAEQANDLASVKIYAQIHTVGYPGGEAIAILAKKSGSSVSTYTSAGGDVYNSGY